MIVQQFGINGSLQKGCYLLIGQRLYQILVLAFFFTLILPAYFK